MSHHHEVELDAIYSEITCVHELLDPFGLAGRMRAYDQFAAAALTGLIARGESDTVQQAFQIADRMMIWRPRTEAELG